MTRFASLLAVAFLCAAECAAAPDKPGVAKKEGERPSGSAFRIPESSRRLLVVVTDSWERTGGTLHRFRRQGKEWERVGSPIPVVVGKGGLGWGRGLFPVEVAGLQGPVKREGDGRSPAGVFTLGPAFGYADQATSGLPYQAMQASDWCMDVPDSPHYNRIVDAHEVGEAAVAGSSEPMRLDLHNDGDVRYRLGFVIGHNPGNVPQGGSCIFAHLWRAPGEPTAGCTAMARRPAMPPCWNRRRATWNCRRARAMSGRPRNRQPPRPYAA